MMDDLKAAYNIISNERAVILGRVAFFFMVITLPFFIYLDFFILKLNEEILYFRIIPLLTGLFYFITTFTPIKKSGHFFIIFYAIILISVMSMMLGLVYLVMATPLFHDSIIATIIIILLISIISVRGMIFLIPVYGIPFAGFTIFTLTSESFNVGNMVTLTNPVILTVGIIILAEIAERSRFKNFVSMKTIEAQTDELKEKSRIIEEKNAIFEKELALARLVQKSLLPASTPLFSSLNTAIIFNPMIDVGGDLYDFVNFTNNSKLGIFISDISGHGVSAAIMSSMVKTLLVTAGVQRLSPSGLLSYLNNNLTGMLADNFLTALYGIYDPELKTFTYSRGGHEYPLLIISDETPVQLLSKGKLIGVTPGLEFEEKTVTLSKGDKILLFTDGLTEAMNESGTMFEKTMINDIIPSISSEPIEIFVRKLYAELLDFKKNTIFEDDICIIGIEIVE